MLESGGGSVKDGCHAAAGPSAIVAKSENAP